MRLIKRNWNEVRFGDVAKKSNENCNPITEGIERFVGGEHMVTDDLRIKKWGTVGKEYAGPAFHRKFNSGQILYGSRRTYLRKVAIADFEGVCANTTYVIDAETRKLNQELLPFIIQSPRFTKHSINNSKGSTNPFINWKDLAKFTFPLPPLKEQQQIASLFQSIETAIEQVEGQEGNLSALQKTLSNGLVSNPPIFGDLLTPKNFKLCSFGDVVDCIEQHDKKPLEKGISRFIGLENIEPGNFNLQGYGNIENGTTFSKRFSKGDVLFGKRRAYLKKLAIADFDGICSGDILVFRAKEKSMLPELLPYYASSEAFIQKAINTSAGSLSPRTKWKDLATFEISVPDLKSQEKIVGVFNQLRDSLALIVNQKETLKKLKQKLLYEILG